ncbi:MAG: hypothetical protein OEZ51_15365 [Nitrospinota bacterium]|nr:hypothetical protein [Nitrospinota bacterium]
MSDPASTVFDHLTDRPIAFFPCFSKVAGSLAAGVLLAQLLYWNKVMGGAEFYKTDAELIDETGLSRHEFRAAKAKLNKSGFIKTTLRGSPAKTHYKVSKSAIIKAISSLPKSGNPVCRKPDNQFAEIRQSSLPENRKLIHTENTTEITTDITTTTTTQADRKFKPEIPKPNGNGCSAHGEGKINGHPPTVPTPDQPPVPPPDDPLDPEDMERAERKAQQEADCKRFLTHAVERHKAQRGIPLVLEPERDADIVMRLVVVKELSADVLCACWNEFVRTERGFFAGKTRTIPLFASPNVLQELLERTNAKKQEGWVQETRNVPKVAPDPEAEGLWRQVLEAIEPEILPDNFDRWLKPTVGLAATREQVVVGVPNRFYQKCLGENYLSQIKKALAQLGVESAPKIEFIHEYEVVDA